MTCSYMGCALEGAHEVDIPGKYGGSKWSQPLCEEHFQFVRDNISPVIQTSEGIRTLKEIKEMFRAKNKRICICPRCGYDH